MTPFKRRFAFIVMLITAITLAAGCSGKKTTSEGDEVSNSIPEAVNADQNSQMGDSDSGRAMGLQTAHFPYDSFTLDSSAKSVLKANAAILKQNSSVKIQIEGHCDQRGGIQYNIALGERRANAVKRYLQDQGISSSRMTTISFGKEKPVDSGMSEEAYAKNRRANFVITSG